MLQKTRALLAVGVLLMATPVLVQQAQTEPYRLGTMDKLRVRVAEWQSAEGAFRDWSAVSGDYGVGPAGTISVPFVGELAVAGKTTEDVATAISDGLQQKLGLPDRPRPPSNWRSSGRSSFPATCRHPAVTPTTRN